MIEPPPRIVEGDIVGPIDSFKVPRFAGPATFARLPRIDEVDRADAVMLGVPFDSGVTYRPGARFGPGHIRESSRLLRPYNPVLDVSPFARLQVVDAGDLAVNPFDLERGDHHHRARCQRRARAGAAPAHPGRRPHDRAAAAARVRGRATARSPSCTSTPTSTPGTPTSAPRTRTAPRSAARPRKA